MFGNIPVAIDGLPDADQALTQTIYPAESEHARLTVVGAVVTHRGEALVWTAQWVRQALTAS